MVLAFSHLPTAPMTEEAGRAEPLCCAAFPLCLDIAYRRLRRSPESRRAACSREAPRAPATARATGNEPLLFVFLLSSFTTAALYVCSLIVLKFTLPGGALLAQAASCRAHP